MKVIPLGKYRGRLFSDIALTDPSYLNWIVLTLSGEIRDAASEALYAGADGKAAGTRPLNRGEVVRAVRGSGEERSSRRRKQALR